MGVISLIHEHAQAEFEAGNDVEVLNILNSKTIESRDDQPYTWAGIAALTSSQVAEQLKGALEANGVTWAVLQLGGTGLSFTNSAVREMVENFIAAGIPLQPVLDATLNYQSPAVVDIGREVTQQDLDDVRLMARKQQLEDAAMDALQTFREALAAWDGSGDPPVLGGE